jgi:hypothetical protein
MFASLSFYLFLTQHQPKLYSASLGSYEKGFVTELSAVRGQISLETRILYGAPTWSRDGVGSLLLDPNDRVFVGNATDELDGNWDDFIGGKLFGQFVPNDRLIKPTGRYFQITEDEAREAWGPGYEQYKEHDNTGYVAGLDVMHLLHCLNFIRQDFNRERYINSKHHAHAHANVDPILHRNHCFEAIRQSLMCHADLAPIPSRYYEVLGQNYIDTNRPHVCRNWNMIRSWVTGRVNGTLKLKHQSF